MALLLGLSIVILVLVALYASERLIFRQSVHGAFRVLESSIIDAFPAILAAVALLMMAAIAAVLSLT
jgi:hypothetical protein